MRTHLDLGRSPSALAGVFAVCALIVALLLAAPPARAASSPHAAGKVALSLPGGGSGPLELLPAQGGRVGMMTVTNVGSEALIVSRIAIFGDEDDVRSPARLSVRFAEGPATSATLGPGASKDIVVSWMPDRNPRTRQAFGHVIVTTTDEASGEVAMGFRAQLPTGLGWIGAHLLSLLVLLPLAVPALAFLARAFRMRDTALVRRVFVGVASLDLAAALWAYARFLPDVGHADGNEGYQFVERCVWVRSIGAEWYLAVDGISITLLPLAAALALAAASMRGAERRGDAHCAALALLTTGVLCALCALDLTLLFAAWQLVFVALVMLVGGWGRRRGEYAAAKLAVYGALGSAALVTLFVSLSSASGRAFLVDGSAVAHTLSIPELARTSFAARTPILGLPFVETAWVLLIVAVAVVAPVVPLHGWLPDVMEEAPPGAAALVSGAVVALGPYLLVRVGLGVMPEGARWAGGTIAALGVLGIAYGSLCALAQRDLRRFAAFAAVANTGACLFGIGALTPQGIAAAVVGLFAHGLSAALILGFAAALERRLHTSELDRLGGMASEVPALAAIAGVGFAVSLGIPGFVGFWGGLLSLLGGFVRHPVLALFMAMAFVGAAAAHVRVVRMSLFGRVNPGWRKSPLLEPFGGRLPDATPDELMTLLPLLAAAILLGVWPAPLFSPMSTAVRELSAVVDPTGADPGLVGK
jgi:NADH-quinone oxidoreductase subunit M